MTIAQEFMADIINKIRSEFHARTVLHPCSDFDTAGNRKKGNFKFHPICLIVV